MTAHDQCILITGANGFIAHALIKRLQADARYRVIGTVREQLKTHANGTTFIHMGELGPEIDWLNN